MLPSDVLCLSSCFQGTSPPAGISRGGPPNAENRENVLHASEQVTVRPHPQPRLHRDQDASGSSDGWAGSAPWMTAANNRVPVSAGGFYGGTAGQRKLDGKLADPAPLNHVACLTDVRKMRHVCFFGLILFL